MDVLTQAGKQARGSKKVMSHIWHIQHRLFAEQLQVIQAKPTHKQLAHLASATRMLLALHPVDQNGYCRICIKSRWRWRPSRHICTVYTIFLDKNETPPTGGRRTDVWWTVVDEGVVPTAAVTG
jgi:hypothetical protein